MSAVVWGSPDARGIALGLEVTGTQAPVAYRIAFANHSATSQKLVLFATLDGRIRTRLVARQGTAEEVRPAIMPAVPISTRYAIEVELAPGETIVRDGVPASFDLVGDAIVFAVHGGVPALPAEIKSGEIAVQLPAHGTTLA